MGELFFFRVIFSSTKSLAYRNTMDCHSFDLTCICAMIKVIVSQQIISFGENYQPFNYQTSLNK